MRIPKKFGERTLHFEATQDEKKKYILAFEGHMTEYQYFSGIADNHALIPIDPIIEIYPLIRSLKNEQYIEMIRKCNQKNYRLFVSNPAFEFWLLLHSDEVFNYNPGLMFSNDRITKNNHKRFIEKELATIFSGYRKECIGFNRFLPHIRKAIDNEKKFCEDIELLKDNLGSNIGLLKAELVKEN
ncbi:MAG: RloB domain-containing protein [Saccharofermentanales bacterium]